MVTAEARPSSWKGGLTLTATLTLLAAGSRAALGCCLEEEEEALLGSALLLLLLLLPAGPPCLGSEALSAALTALSMLVSALVGERKETWGERRGEEWAECMLFCVKW